MILSIIIVSWNVKDLLRQCLDSIYCQHPLPEIEAIVIDNSSIDNSPEMVKKQFPQVKLIENQENVGFARANNQGILQSSGRYVLLLNPDTEVKQGALKSIVDYMEAHQEVGGAGAKLFNPDGTMQLSCSPEPTLLREFFRMFHLPPYRADGYYQMSDWDQKRPQEVDIILGACLILRREALNQIGLLDEKYFIYSEEVDICHRLKIGGWRLFWVPQSEVVHYGGQSTRQVREEMFLCLYQGKVLYFRKHYDWTTVQIYKLILIISALSRLFLSPLARLEPAPSREYHLALAKNYMRLLIALPNM